MNLEAILDAIKNAKSKAELRTIYNGTFAGRKPSEVTQLNHAMQKRWVELSERKPK